MDRDRPLYREYFDLAHQLKRVVYFPTSENAAEQLSKHVCTGRKDVSSVLTEKKPLICSFCHSCGNAVSHDYAG